MSSIFAIILFAVLFLLFAMNKEYVQIIVTLIIVLIVDFVIVNGFANMPLFGTIAVSVGGPFISILLYAILEMVLMGVFYILLQRNYVIAFVVYLISSVLINKFCMALSGNILIDFICNSIIAGIIFVLYNKLDYLDDIKWFSIIAMVVNFILASLISLLFFA